MSRHAQVIGSAAAIGVALLAIVYVVTYEPAPNPPPPQLGNTFYSAPARVSQPKARNNAIQAVFMADKPRAPDWLEQLSSSAPVGFKIAGPSNLPDKVEAAQPVNPLASPYSQVGALEQDGVKLVALARDDRILLKRQGEDVDPEFRLAAIEPPMLLHLPTGSLLPVHRSSEAQLSNAAPRVAPLLASQPIVADTAHATPSDPGPSAAEIEAEIAAALAVPVSKPSVPSAFPLSR